LKSQAIFDLQPGRLNQPNSNPCSVINKERVQFGTARNVFVCSTAQCNWTASDRESARGCPLDSSIAILDDAILEIDARVADYLDPPACSSTSLLSHRGAQPPTSHPLQSDQSKEISGWMTCNRRNSLQRGDVISGDVGFLVLVSCRTLRRTFPTCLSISAPSAGRGPRHPFWCEVCGRLGTAVPMMESYDEPWICERSSYRGGSR
jgi:hypothetical protein